jgi:hypothetical protein
MVSGWHIVRIQSWPNVLSQHLTGWPEENTTDLNQGKWIPGWDSKWLPPNTSPKHYWRGLFYWWIFVQEIPILNVNTYSFRCNLLLPSLSSRLRFTSWATKHRGFDSRQGQQIFFFSKASTPAPAHIQPHISSPSSAEVTSECNYTHPQARTAWNENVSVTNLRKWTAIHPLKT